jgi:hypothetical protein
MSRTVADTTTHTAKRRREFQTRYWSARQLADYFGISERTLQRWVKDERKGLAPRMIVNGVWFFSPEDVGAFEQRHAVIA